MGIAEIGRVGREAPAENIVYISALTGQGTELLIDRIEALVSAGKRRITYFIPNSDGGALNSLYKLATVESVDYGAEGMTVVALADARARGMMRKYALDDTSDTDEEKY